MFAVPSLGVPLFPLQLLWINLLTDGLPALALGVDPPDPALMQQPPRDSRARLLDLPHLRRLAARAVVLAGGAMAAVLASSYLLQATGPEARTVLFTTLVVAQVLYAYVVRRKPGATGPLPRNRWLSIAVVGALALHTLIVLAPPAQPIFDTTTLTPAGWITAITAGIAAPLAIGLAQRLRGEG